ncbi:MAG: L-2-amino-thiazoline-4-carboxylic acid hydrolase [Candidatus Heimdallarchaeota archaeon]|nr:L-2-amino-thiazoline-4-carboxylic acid hydrolase [Candidatus Heimdallarchaeota archaeon]MCK5143502.1 L-2-amino-thiazoline-4-carboxylic acid hydrolase [Candidatus Heimdallarchaeota archaeon]
MQEPEFSYKRKKLFKRLNKLIKVVKTILSDSYTSAEIDSIIVNTTNEIETLLPQIPYIGSKDNVFLVDFLDSIMLLALFKELTKRGSSVRDVGQIMYMVREIQASNQSRIYNFLAPKLMFNSVIKNSYKRKVNAMTKNAYPENWLMEFVEGDGEEFDWGVNCHECAVSKFYKKHGGEEIFPYVCMVDYAPFNVMKNVEFKRTQTLAGGGPYCDFRFKKGGSTPRGWPPEEREDFQYE